MDWIPPETAMITGAPVVLKPFPYSFMSRYVCPVLVSFLAISATLIVTVSILYWNYSETMYAFMITVFNNFIRFSTQVPGTRYPDICQQSFLSQVPPCHKKVHGARPLGQEGTFPCQYD